MNLRILRHAGEAEKQRTFQGHCVQYAVVRSLPGFPIVLGTDNMENQEILEEARARAGGSEGLVIIESGVGRYNRCPECEQWTTYQGRVRDLPCPAVQSLREKMQKRILSPLQAATLGLRDLPLFPLPLSTPLPSAILSQPEERSMRLTEDSLQACASLVSEGGWRRGRLMVLGSLKFEWTARGQKWLADSSSADSSSMAVEGWLGRETAEPETAAPETAESGSKTP